MSAPLRLMLETNVEVSAFLWKGKPGRLLALAGEGDIRMFRSQFMLDELTAGNTQQAQTGQSGCSD
jgi:predicted nucleic acid-binding protein